MRNVSQEKKEGILSLSLNRLEAEMCVLVFL